MLSWNGCEQERELRIEVEKTKKAQQEMEGLKEELERRQKEVDVKGKEIADKLKQAEGKRIVWRAL